MKIISNGEVYIQDIDLERLLRSDKTFPLSMYYDTKGTMGYVRSPKEFIKIENERTKKFIKRTHLIPDFKTLNYYTIEELERQIRNLKRELDDTLGYEDTERPLTAESKIETYKRKRDIDYMISQLREMIAYKKGKSLLIYPCVPNPGHRVFKIGELNATLSINNEDIICYPKEGKTLDDIPSLAYEVAIQELKHDMKDYNEEEFELETERKNNDKYLVISLKK